MKTKDTEALGRRS